MRKITFEARFMKGGQYAFTAVMFAGYNGVATAYKPGAFSISINERKPSWRTDPMGLVLNFWFLFSGAQQVTKLTRDTLLTCNDYKCAYDKLSTSTVISPCYLIIAGTKDYEGAVITKDRTTVAHVDQLSENRWYLLQTNDDHFKGVCTVRCEAANARIKKIGRNITPAQLKDDVLLQYPNLNFHGIYNTLMIPGQSNFVVQTIFSDRPDPDMPTTKYHSYF